MFTQKLLATVGLAAALFIGAASEASANPFRGPVVRPAPVYRAPVVYVPAPAPVYRAPVVYVPAPAPAPVYRAPVVYVPAPTCQTPVYVPAHRGPVWGHRHWAHGRGHRF